MIFGILKINLMRRRSKVSEHFAELTEVNASRPTRDSVPTAPGRQPSVRGRGPFRRPASSRHARSEAL